MNLGPQFLYHGTSRDVEGAILPATVHGKGSHWGSTGTKRGEPAEEHAWAHPSENVAWHAAHQRVIDDTLNDRSWNPRARVYAVHPNEQQSPGSDMSMAGEIKAPRFDIAQQVDIMPGRQGTFPGVNWNDFTRHTGTFSEDEDANHPKNLSVQFGHRYGHMGEHGEHGMWQDARKEDEVRYIDRLDSRNARGYKPVAHRADTPLPIHGVKKR